MSSVKSVIISKTNGPLIAEAAKLWIKPTDVVMDVTYGRGLFWTHYKHPGTFIAHDLAIDGIDFRALPETDGSIDVVIFDPPYISPGGRKTSTVKDFNDRYGLVDAPKNPMETRVLISHGIKEAARVLKPGGIFMVKTCNYISSGKYQLGHDQVTFDARQCGLVQEDEFIHVSGTGPQPKFNLDGTPRRQVHSRRSHSFLSVFKKP